MVFQGFGVSYPDYEVITPQSGLSFSVRSLNVQEEERLKGSLMTPQKITEHLNKCIFESLTKKPKEVTDFDSFLKMVTLKDRDALLYGLYHISYGDIRDYDITCSSCRKEYPVTVKASDTFIFKQYPQKDILSKEIKCDLPTTKGVSVYIKQPTLENEIKYQQELGSRPNATSEMITETLIITKFSQNIEQKVEPIIYSERADILDAYLTLPSKDKRKIYKEYADNFGQYGIELKMKTYCQHCGFEEVADIDLVSAFFRVLYSL